VQTAVGSHPWPDGAPVRVRIGLHTGEPLLEGGAYLGVDVSRAARVCAAGHGGQTLLSQTTRDLVADSCELKELGVYPLAGLPRPEPIFQLVVPSLRSDFPPLRVAAERRRLRPKLPRRRSRLPTLEEAAFAARELLPRVPTEAQAPLAELGAAFFTGHRAVVSADRLLARVDRKGLARRLAEQRRLAVLSPRARRSVEVLGSRIASVEQLHDRRHALAELAGTLTGAHQEAFAPHRIAELRGRVTTATTELDAAVARAASALDPTSFRLERTRHRGVYRSNGRYVVPYTDELGSEGRREFDTRDEARDFRAALRAAEKHQSQYTGPGDWGHGMPP
jgi:hypothetical protein